MEERLMSVYRGSIGGYVPLSKIIIQGQRLENLGFSIGDKVDMTCEKGRLNVEKRETGYSSEGINNYQPVLFQPCQA